MARFWTTLGSLMCAMMLIGGCSNTSSEKASVPDQVDCHIFYRASMGMAFSESTLELTPSVSSEVTAGENFTVAGRYLQDPGEGPAVTLTVVDASSGTEIVRHLYQIDREHGLRNQFIGGHGFTGLAYVFEPGSTGELQYYCEAR